MSYLTFKAADASVASTITPKWVSIGTGGCQYRAVGATEWIDIPTSGGTVITVDTTGIEMKADNLTLNDEPNHRSHR